MVAMEAISLANGPPFGREDYTAALPFTHTIADIVSEDSQLAGLA